MCCCVRAAFSHLNVYPKIGCAYLTPSLKLPSHTLPLFGHADHLHTLLHPATSIPSLITLILCHTNPLRTIPYLATITYLLARLLASCLGIYNFLLASPLYWNMAGFNKELFS